MKLSNPHELTQLEFEVNSLMSVVKQMIGETTNNEINPGQNQRIFDACKWGIEKHLSNLKADLERVN